MLQGAVSFQHEEKVKTERLCKKRNVLTREAEAKFELFSKYAHRYEEEQKKFTNNGESEVQGDCSHSIYCLKDYY